MIDIHDIIDEIVHHVKRKDYESAAILVFNNNISLQQLASVTIRLGIIDFARLADHVIKIHSQR